eukprot:359972-Chlamydomonas_euryale.AAC.9
MTWAGGRRSAQSQQGAEVGSGAWAASMAAPSPTPSSPCSPSPAPSSHLEQEAVRVLDVEVEAERVKQRALRHEDLLLGTVEVGELRVGVSGLAR